uniref:Uncharacterized protein n=1 Tax=Acrobeloides nanus TaxID=290746 RepID=A0A914D142_9BILA
MCSPECGRFDDAQMDMSVTSCGTLNEHIRCEKYRLVTLQLTISSYYRATCDNYLNFIGDILGSEIFYICFFGYG